MKKSLRQRIIKAAALAVVIMMAGSLYPKTVVSAAEEYPDVMLGVFFNSNADRSDTMYMSMDGYNFYKLGVALEDDTPTVEGQNHAAGRPSTVYTFSDPSIMEKDGGFWMISGTSLGNYSDGTVRAVPMLGYSEDLVNWSCGNSGFFNLADNLKIKDAPAGQEKWGQYDKWDFGSADFFLDDDGSVWVYFSAGYYADYHGDDFQNDIMAPYCAHITNLAPDPEKDYMDSGWQPQITYESQYAMPINLPEHSNNRIDGSFYKEDGWYYLVIKENGITNELWRTKDLGKCDDEGSWEKVSPNIQSGSEGASITSLGGQYYMFSDKLAPWPAVSEAEDINNANCVYANVTSGIGAYKDDSHGVYVCTSSNINDPYSWSGAHKIQTFDTAGNILENRHGTVITVTNYEAKKKIWDLYRSQYGTKTPSTTGHPLDNGWVRKDYKEFVWFENGVRQGYEYGNPSYRGKEIYDPGTNAWYWLDNIQGGMMAYNKDVYQESLAGDWGDYTGADGKKMGKWVRYDYYGHMKKGEAYDEDPNNPGEWNYYYFDLIYGTMAKGDVSLPDGRNVYYDTNTGKMIVTMHKDESTGATTVSDYVRNGTIYLTKENGDKWNGWYLAGTDSNGQELWYWYENGLRQGYAMNEDGSIDESYRGKEIFDGTGWYWLDNVQKGAKAMNKAVYQESSGGKWVRYNQYGTMLKGWQVLDDGTFYFDLITGAMQKGTFVENGETYFFNETTGRLSYHVINSTTTWYYDDNTGKLSYAIMNGVRFNYDAATGQFNEVR